MPDAHAVLVAELDDLARHLVQPDPDADVVAGAIAQIRRGSRRRYRSLLAVAAVIVVIGLVLTFVAPARRAVADWLGIRGERVTTVDELPSRLGTTLDLGGEIDIEDAHERAPAPVTFPDGIGAPAAAFAGRPDGGVSFVWAPSSELPGVLQLDVGLLLTTFRGDLERDSVAKLLPPGTTIESVDVRGAQGYWLGGDAHAFLYLDAEDEQQRDTARLAANTLIWERDGVTYRLESALDRDAALQLARGTSGE